MRRVAYCDAHSAGATVLHAPGRHVDDRAESWTFWRLSPQECHMHSIIYLVGVVVIVLAILSFVGLN